MNALTSAATAVFGLALALLLAVWAFLAVSAIGTVTVVTQVGERLVCGTRRLRAR